MAIDREQVLRIAELARLEIADGDVETLAAQLSRVLEFAAVIDRLDLSAQAPSSLAPADAPPRADVPNGRRLEPGVATAAAPEGDEDFFYVPPIVENLNP